MPRRRRTTGAEDVADGLAEFLRLTPVWMGPVLAVVVGLLMRFVGPLLFDGADDAAANVFSGLCRTLAPFATLFVLIVWIFAELQKWSRRRLLDTRSDIDSLRALSWQEFEQLVGEAYRRQGYQVGERGGGGADGGVDLVLHKGGRKTLVQCKQWKTWKVDVRIVRELYGVMAAERASRGVVVTCGAFTQEARRFAEDKHLELVDGPALLKLVLDGQAGTRPQPRGALQAAPAPVARPGPAPIAAVPKAPPPCPACGSPMVLRTARRGRNAGSQFYGCTRYPNCRGIVNLARPAS